jgi:hypothetical protein
MTRAEEVEAMAAFLASRQPTKCPTVYAVPSVNAPPPGEVPLAKVPWAASDKPWRGRRRSRRERAAVAVGVFETHAKKKGSA